MENDNQNTIWYDRKSRKFKGLEQAHIDELKQVYKTVDVDLELKKMSLWLQTPRGLFKRGDYGFIINWLNNTPSRPILVKDPYDINDSPIRPLLLEYLRELWKGKEHILELNKLNKKS